MRRHLPTTWLGEECQVIPPHSSFRSSPEPIAKNVKLEAVLAENAVWTLFGLKTSKLDFLSHERLPNWFFLRLDPPGQYITKVAAKNSPKAIVAFCTSKLLVSLTIKQVRFQHFDDHSIGIIGTEAIYYSWIGQQDAQDRENQNYTTWNQKVFQIAFFCRKTRGSARF